MICLECGGTYKKVTNTHLKRCCGLTEAQYRERYPGAELVDEAVKKLYGSPLEKNTKWKGGVSKPLCRGCGKKVTEKSRITLCRKCSIREKGNPFAGKTHTAETRQRMSAAAALRDRATYKPGVASHETASRARKQYWARIPQEERSSLLASFIEAGQRNNKRNAQTKIENSVAHMLTRQGVCFSRNCQVGRYNVDFLIGGAIIECYGDYWHCNPGTYAADFYHKSLHMTAESKWAKDAARTHNLQEAGHSVLCLWENDIHYDPLSVETEIIKFLKGNNHGHNKDQDIR